MDGEPKRVRGSKRNLSTDYAGSADTPPFQEEDPQQTTTDRRNQTSAEVEVPAFTYEDLDQHENQIRLLRILPPLQPNSRKSHGDEAREATFELFHANLDDHPSYKALSYTWGSQSDPNHTIYLNGCQFLVRENLWNALRRFQSDNVELVIWIDAICINQTSDIERNHQVANMKMVYEQATEVVVWLGSTYERSDLAIQLVHELYNHRESTEWITERFSKPDIEQKLGSLAGLLSCRYWYRIWIVQELTVARKIVFYFGERSIKAKSLHAIQQLFRQMENLDRFPNDLLQDVLQRNQSAISYLRYHGIQSIYHWKQDLVSTKPNFYTCLLHHYYRESSDPRDMIYGLAALANQTSKYKVEVDYKLSTRNVFTNFAKLEIETSKKLDIITRVLPGTNIHELPSWVPDWSNATEAWSHFFLYDISQPQFRYSSAGETRAVVHLSADRIAFKGVNIGSIELLSLESGMEDYRDKPNGTLALFKLWELVTRIGKTSSEDLEAFVRVLVFDRAKKEYLGMRTKSEFLLGILGYLGLVFSDSKLIEAKTSILLSHWKSFLVLQKKDNTTMEESFVEAEAKVVIESWWDVILNLIWDRRFFISSSKAMGLASERVVEGDLICIPLGCCHPVILRKVDDHYINLGEAFVDGYMYGEAMEMLERGS
ncbi:heterokaryon incompatibility protein-domain-containing protein [Hyaloscypha finlandica]|nr:heterokaryon incompatibility protein-domain-containing protein [Hyaloscypha finlandica]